jgi:hypothetical protein
MRYRIGFACIIILLFGPIPSSTLGQFKRGKGGGLAPNAVRLADQQALDDFGPAFLEAYERAKELRRALQFKASDATGADKATSALDLFLQAGKPFAQLVQQRLDAQAAQRAKLDGGFPSDPDFRQQIVKLRRDLDSALIAIEQMKATMPSVAKSPAVGKAPVSAQEKDTNSVQSIFDGCPAGLTTKALFNRIRRDRVNDWLQENFNGKSKVVQLQVPMHVVATRAKDGTYVISLRNDGIAAKVFGETWLVQANGENEGAQRGFQFPFGANGPRFVFEGVSAVDAEKLTDSRTVTIQAKVKEATLAPQNQGPDEDSPPYYLRLVLEDVQLNGKAYTPRKMAPLSKGKGR